ncbi:unnamed protein product [Closterium sp. Naga37s-1]|nr:unnamed protein product [Closterium sp. Naga37s-1]
MESEKLTYGDVVCLGCMDLHGYLTGSGLVDERVRCEILDDNVDVPPCLDNAKFEVRIKYQYSLWNTKDDAHGSSVARPGHIPPKEGEGASKAEQAFNNAEFVRSVGSPVLYGQVVQLLHVSSHKFLTVKRTQSELEKSHLKVVLQKGGDMGSWFCVTPTYKIKREGEHVAFGDAATFTSVKFNGAGLRVSEGSCDTTVMGAHPYVADTREVNAGPEMAGWRIIPFALHESRIPNARQLLKGGDAVMLIHRASEMNLVCDEGKVVFEARKQDGGPSSNALWMVQPTCVEWGGRPLPYDQGFTLRHLASGLFLESKRQPQSSQDLRLDDFSGALTVTDLYRKPSTIWTIGAVTQGYDKSAVLYQSLLRCQGVHGYVSGGLGEYSMTAGDSSSRALLAQLDSLYERKSAGLTQSWDQKDALVFEVASHQAVKLTCTQAHSAACVRNFVAALDRVDDIEPCADDYQLKKSIRSSGLLQVLLKYGPAVSEQLERLIRALVVSDMPDVLNLRGPPNQVYQVLQREQKVLTGVMTILETLLIRKGLPQNSIMHPHLFGGFDVRRLCKLVNRYLQAACRRCRPNQDQLAPYIPLLEQLVGNEIYTSGTLMAIVADNEHIISSVTVENIRQRIINCRTFQRPRDIRFLNIICSCGGAPVRTNQNVVVDILKENSDVLVKARVAPSENGVGEETLLLERDGLVVDCGALESLDKLGAHSDSIHRSPQEVLFLFYVVTLELFCTLCMQRNRKAIDWLIEDSDLYGLDYHTLRMVVFNPSLPFFLRTNCCRLLTHLYIDREPFEERSYTRLVLTWPAIDNRQPFPEEESSEEDDVSRAMADPFLAFPHKAPEPGFTALKHNILDFLPSTTLAQTNSRPGQSSLTFAVLQTASLMLRFGLFGSFSGQGEEGIAPIVDAVIPLLDGRSEKWGGDGAAGGDALRFKSDPESNMNTVMEVGVGGLNAEGPGEAAGAMRGAKGKGGKEHACMASIVGHMMCPALRMCIFDMHVASLSPFSCTRSLLPSNPHPPNLSQAKTVICSMLMYIFDMRSNWCITTAFDAYSRLGDRATTVPWDMPANLSRTAQDPTDVPSPAIGAPPSPAATLDATSTATTPATQDVNGSHSALARALAAVDGATSPHGERAGGSGGAGAAGVGVGGLPQSGSTGGLAAVALAAMAASKESSRKSMWRGMRLKLEANNLKTHGRATFRMFPPDASVFEGLSGQLFKRPALSALVERVSEGGLPYMLEVLLDLTRYQYAPLKAYAFSLIDRYMTEKASLLRKMLECHIIVDADMMLVYKQVARDVSVLRSLQGWLGSDDSRLRVEVRRRCVRLLGRFKAMCTVGPGQNEAQVLKHQTILQTVGAHLCSVDLLRTPFRRVASHEPGVMDCMSDRGLQDLFSAAYQFLAMFCAGVVNEELQLALHAHMGVFLPHRGLASLNVMALLCAMLKDNYELCSTVSHDHLWACIKLILRYGKRATWLQFLETVVLVNGKPIARNQMMVLDMIIDYDDQISGLPHSPTHWRWREALMRRNEHVAAGVDSQLRYHTAYVSLIAACCWGNNPANAVKVSGLVGLGDIMATLLWLASETAVSADADSEDMDDAGWDEEELMEEVEEGEEGEEDRKGDGGEGGEESSEVWNLEISSDGDTQEVDSWSTVTSETSSIRGVKRGGGGGNGSGRLQASGSSQRRLDPRMSRSFPAILSQKEAAGASLQAKGSQSLKVSRRGQGMFDEAGRYVWGEDDEEDDEGLCEEEDEEGVARTEQARAMWRKTNSMRTWRGEASEWECRAIPLEAVHAVKAAYVRLLHQAYVTGHSDRATAEIRDEGNGMWPDARDSEGDGRGAAGGIRSPRAGSAGGASELGAGPSSAEKAAGWRGMSGTVGMRGQPVSLMEDTVTELRLAAEESFDHAAPEGSALHYVTTAALPMLSAYFKRHFTSRAALPDSHRRVLDELVSGIWELCSQLPASQQEACVRCVEEMKAAGALKGTMYDPLLLPFAMDRQMSRLKSSELARKGAVFKSNWVNFSRLFSHTLEITDLHTMEGSGARDLALLLSQQRLVMNSVPPFHYSDVVRQLTLLLSAPKIPDEMTPDLIVRFLRVCSAMIYLTEDTDTRSDLPAGVSASASSSVPTSVSATASSTSTTWLVSDDRKPLVANITHSLGAAVGAVPAATGAAAGASGAAGAGEKREEQVSVGLLVLRPEEKARAMSKWEMFEASLPVRYSKSSLDALDRVQCKYADLGLAECAVRLVSHGNQWVQAEAVKLAIALTDEGNSKVQDLMYAVLVEDGQLFFTVQKVLAAASATIKFVRKGLDKQEARARKEAAGKRQMQEMAGEGFGEDREGAGSESARGSVSGFFRGRSVPTTMPRASSAISSRGGRVQAADTSASSASAASAEAPAAASAAAGAEGGGSVLTPSMRSRLLHAAAMMRRAAATEAAGGEGPKAVEQQKEKEGGAGGAEASSGGKQEEAGEVVQEEERERVGSLRAFTKSRSLRIPRVTLADSPSIASDDALTAPAAARATPTGRGGSKTRQPGLPKASSRGISGRRETGEVEFGGGFAGESGAGGGGDSKGGSGLRMFRRAVSSVVTRELPRSSSSAAHFPMPRTRASMDAHVKAGRRVEGSVTREEDEDEEESEGRLQQEEEDGFQLWNVEESASHKDTTLHKKAWVVLSGHVTNVLRMLQLLCEGHNARMQRLLRVQDDTMAAGAVAGGGGGGGGMAYDSGPWGGGRGAGGSGAGSNGRSVNLLQEIIVFLEHLQPSLDKNLSQHNPLFAQIALQALNTLLEAIQGPCFENQLALVRSNFLSITQRMMASLTYRDERVPAPDEHGEGGEQPVRFSPEVIAKVLSYTALGDRPAGSLDCPMLGPNDLRTWVRNGILSVYLSLLEEIGSNHEIPSKMAAVIDFSALLQRCRYVRGTILNEFDAFSSTAARRFRGRSTLSLSEMLEATGLAAVAAAAGAGSGGGAGGGNSAASGSKWGGTGAAAAPGGSNSGSGSGVGGSSSGGSGGAGAGSSGGGMGEGGDRAAGSGGEQEGASRQEGSKLPLWMTFNSDALNHLLPSEVLNSLMIMIKLDDFDRWMFASSEASNASSSSSAALAARDWSGAGGRRAMFATCTYSILKCDKPQRCGTLCFGHTLAVSDSELQNFFSHSSCAIEVVREGQLEKVYFPLTAECRRLSRDPVWTMAALEELYDVPRENPIQKVQHFMRAARVLVLKLQHYERMRHRHPWAGWLQDMLPQIKRLPFYTSILIVTLIVFSYGQTMQPWAHYAFALALIRVLGLLQLLVTSLALVGFIWLESPLLVLKDVAGDEREADISERMTRGDGAAVDAGEAGLDQRLNESMDLRGVPKSLLFRNLDFWYSVLMVVASVLGLSVSPFFFVFHLLDFIIYHPSGAIVLKSAYVGGPLLIRTGLVGILVIFMYSIVSFLAFAGHDDFACTTLYECIGLHLVNAIASSSIGGLWQAWDTVPTSVVTDVWRQLRTVFIVSFLIVWVFLLQNIFTGQIVDAFTSIRDEKAAKEKDLDDKCFVCSIDRFAFEQRLGGFVEHIAHEHNPLHYLFYIDYLLKRNPTEYTGLESFVRAHLDASNYDWIPIGRAMHTDRLQQVRAKQNDNHASLDSMRAAIDRMDARMRLLEASIDSLRGDVGRASVRVKGGNSMGRLGSMKESSSGGGFKRSLASGSSSRSESFRRTKTIAVGDRGVARAESRGGGGGGAASARIRGAKR